MDSLLVTGGLGFIGSNFVHHILETRKDALVTNLDYEGLGSNRANVADLSGDKRYRYVKADLSEKISLRKAMKDAELIVNFAAETHVDRSIANPELFFKSNATGLFNLLELVRENKVRRIVHVSTDEVYGSKLSGSFAENSPLNPSSPYSATKAAADLMARAWHTTYKVPVIVVRCTNNFGPYQHPEKFIPKIIIRALNGQEVPLYGGGKQIRDWIYVRDFCTGIEKALENGELGEVYNFSAGNEVSNRHVAERVLKLMSKTDVKIISVEDRPGHDYRYSLSSEKARHEFDWKPEHSFDNALQLTVKWYLEHPSWWKPLINDKVLSATPWKEKW